MGDIGKSEYGMLCMYRKVMRISFGRGPPYSSRNSSKCYRGIQNMWHATQCTVENLNHKICTVVKLYFTGSFLSFPFSTNYYGKKSVNFETRKHFLKKKMFTQEHVLVPGFSTLGILQYLLIFASISNLEFMITHPSANRGPIVIL